MRRSLTILMTAVLSVIITVQATAQNDYVKFLGIYLDTIPGKSGELVKGLKEHNAQFHTDGPNKTYVWSIMTGPNSGKYMWPRVR